MAQALGAALTALRTQRKVSQDMIALKSGYSVQWINRLERGKANITMQVLVAMADIFQLRPSQLLARAERKQRKGQSKSSAPISAKEKA